MPKIPNPPPSHALRLAPLAIASLALAATGLARAQSGSLDFQGARTWDVSGEKPHDMAFADVDNDGDQDLIVAEGSGDVVVQLNTKSRFGQDLTFDPGFDAYGVGVGDFNEDGHVDLAVTSGNKNATDVRIFLGDTTILGTFNAGALLTATNLPVDAEAGDFDGDGHLDLAVACREIQGLITFKGHGDGTFDAGVAVAGSLGMVANDLVVADVNGDGKLDLLLGHATGVTLFPGAGDGTFPTAVTAMSGAAADGVGAGDFDGDARLDVVWCTASSDTLALALQQADGSFVAGYSTTVATAPSELVVADFDQDNVADVVVAMFGSDDVAAFAGAGDGTLFAPTRFAADVEPVDLVAVDIDRDGRLDLGVIAHNGGTTPRLSSLINNTVNSPWQNLYHGNEGDSGVPQLRGSGTPSANQSVTLTLKNSASNAPTFMIVGLSTLYVPFLGGTLVPAPDWILFVGNTDSAGQMTLSGTIPSGTPPGLEVDFQDWLIDAHARLGFAASNGLKMVTQ